MIKKHLINSKINVSNPNDIQYQTATIVANIIPMGLFWAFIAHMCVCVCFFVMCILFGNLMYVVNKWTMFENKCAYSIYMEP